MYRTKRIKTKDGSAPKSPFLPQRHRDEGSPRLKNRNNRLKIAKPRQKTTRVLASYFKNGRRVSLKIFI